VIQLQILSGKQAGDGIVVRHFPFLVGRSTNAGLRADEPGVWDRHIEIGFDRETGFTFTTQPNAPVLVNGARSEGGPLHNGDTLDLGALRLRFWLAATAQKTMRLREGCTWAALIFLFVVQIGLIYFLLS
jgi:predicted component of type VI protein secretion system